MNIEELGSKKANEIINTREPKGLFLHQDGDGFVAIDNQDGRAWTEDFKNKEVAIKWLFGDIEVEEAYELDLEIETKKLIKGVKNNEK